MHYFLLVIDKSGGGDNDHTSEYESEREAKGAHFGAQMRTRMEGEEGGAPSGSDEDGLYRREASARFDSFWRVGFPYSLLSSSWRCTQSSQEDFIVRDS